MQLKAPLSCLIALCLTPALSVQAETGKRYSSEELSEFDGRPIGFECVMLDEQTELEWVSDRIVKRLGGYLRIAVQPSGDEHIFVAEAFTNTGNVRVSVYPRDDPGAEALFDEVVGFKNSLGVVKIEGADASGREIDLFFSVFEPGTPVVEVFGQTIATQCSGWTTFD